MLASAMAFEDLAGDGPGDAFRVGDEPGGAVGVGGCQCRRDVGERAGLRGFIGDGLGDAFRVGQEASGAGSVGSGSLRVPLSRLGQGIPVRSDFMNDSEGFGIRCGRGLVHGAGAGRRD